MQATELTAHDREWLHQHAQACKLGFDFMLQDVLRPCAANATAAQIVPIWYKGAYEDVSTVLKFIEKDLPRSQIFEQWEHYRYQAVIRVCRSLSQFDARALLVASGFAYQDANVMCKQAGEAVAYAIRELYGDENDGDDDFESDTDDEFDWSTVE
ncbi:hypothetical protein [Pseudomonas sp. MWU12-2323]|uniref:hypothetical protein n=1 Tax=Pseudomonas sp. MWU12-2323 TaxID=2651296 RepID=UPI00128E8E68|nr:hypothetical protein [Pseudomonas sp. MWU12-2323]MPQ69343.1 hypothetical protein [Pseudomonas sp. MWU12-2323]